MNFKRYSFYEQSLKGMDYYELGNEKSARCTEAAAWLVGSLLNAAATVGSVAVELPGPAQYTMTAVFGAAALGCMYPVAINADRASQAEQRLISVQSSLLMRGHMPEDYIGPAR